MNTHTHTRTHINTCARGHTHTHTHANTRTHIHIYTNTLTHTHTHTNTYTHSSPIKHSTDCERIYIGISAGNSKQRLYNYKYSFFNQRLIKQTTLSKYLWSLKERGLHPI